LSEIFSNTKTHVIQKTQGPVSVSPPKEARLSQSAVVNYSPEYEKHFLFENNIAPNSVIHEIQERWRLLFPHKGGEKGKIGRIPVRN